jgi:hypothetical protein
MGRVWTKQPPAGTPIDWSHPLAKDLAIFCYHLTPTQFIDAVYNDVYSMDAAGIDVGEGYYRSYHPVYGRGVGIDTPTGIRTGGPRDNTFDPKERFTSTTATIAAIYTAVEAVAGSKTAFGMLHNANSDILEVAQPPFNAAVTFSTNFSNANNSTSEGAWDNAVAGEHHCVAGVFIDSGVSGDFKKWHRNISTGDFAASTDTGEAKFVPATLNSDLDSIYMSQGDNCSTYVGAYWNRELTEEELFSFSENPWQIFKPKPQFIAVDVPEDTRHAVVEKPWTKQPPAGTKLDKNHPFYRNFLSVVPCYEPSGAPKDLISGRTVTFTGGTRTRTDGRSTLAMAKDADSDAIGVDVVVPSDGGTMLLVYDPGSGFSGSSDSMMGSTTTDSYGLRRASGNVVLRWGGIDVVNVNAGTGWREDSDDQVVVAGVDADLSLLRIGKTTYTDTGLTGFANLGNFRLQEGFGVSDNGMQVVMWAILDRRLTESEAISFERNPWQIFEPQKIVAPIDEKLPDLATFEKEHTSMPARPPK